MFIYPSENQEPEDLNNLGRSKSRNSIIGLKLKDFRMSKKTKSYDVVAAANITLGVDV